MNSPPSCRPPGCVPGAPDPPVGWIQPTLCRESIMRKPMRNRMVTLAIAPVVALVAGLAGPRAPKREAAGANTLTVSRVLEVPQPLATCAEAASGPCACDIYKPDSFCYADDIHVLFDNACTDGDPGYPA